MSLGGTHQMTDDVIIYNFREEDNKRRTKKSQRQTSQEETLYDIPASLPTHRPNANPPPILPLPRHTAHPGLIMTSLPALPTNQNLYVNTVNTQPPLFYSDDHPGAYNYARSAVVPNGNGSNNNPYAMYQSAPVLAYQYPVSYITHPSNGVQHVVPPATAGSKPGAGQQRQKSTNGSPQKKKMTLWSRFPCVVALVIVLCVLMVGAVIAVVVLVKYQ